MLYTMYLISTGGTYNSVMCNKVYGGSHIYLKRFTLLYIYRKSTNLLFVMVKIFLSDYDEDMFQLTSAIDLGPGGINDRPFTVFIQISDWSS